MASMSGKELSCGVVSVVGIFVFCGIIVIFNIKRGLPVTTGSYVSIVVFSLGLMSILVYITKKYCDSEGKNIRDIESTEQQQTIVRLTTDGYAVTVVRRSFVDRIINALKTVILEKGKGMQV